MAFLLHVSLFVFPFLHRVSDLQLKNMAIHATSQKKYVTLQPKCVRLVPLKSI